MNIKMEVDYWKCRDHLVGEIQSWNWWGIEIQIGYGLIGWKSHYGWWSIRFIGWKGHYGWGAIRFIYSKKKNS